MDARVNIVDDAAFFVETLDVQFDSAQLVS